MKGRRASLILGLIFVQPLYAQITVVGGTVAATATAGESQPFYTVGTDNPPPMSLQSGGASLSISASAQGTAFQDYAPDPAQVSSGSSADLSAEGFLEVSSSSNALFAHQGSGFWCCASSSGDSTLLFSLSAPIQVDLFTTNSTDNGPADLLDELTDLSTGAVLLRDSGVGDGLTSLLLPAGQYQESASTSVGDTWGYQGELNSADLQIGCPTGCSITVSTVPVPGALWLFSSAILALGFLFRLGGWHHSK